RRCRRGPLGPYRPTALTEDERKADEETGEHRDVDPEIDAERAAQHDDGESEQRARERDEVGRECGADETDKPRDEDDPEEGRGDRRRVEPPAPNDDAAVEHAAPENDPREA